MQDAARMARYDAAMDRVFATDSHTAGEPTRTVISGGPALGDGPLAERRARLRADHDGFRSAVVCEPRGSDVLVGALLVPPADAACTIGVVFFNNVGMLGMCGHGTIGVVETLRHLGRIGAGVHRIETPVGTVATELHADGRVTVANVASYRHRRAACVDVPGLGRVCGDVAWGGNWFFLVGWERPIALAHVPVPHGERSYALPGHSTKFRACAPAVAGGPNSST